MAKKNRKDRTPNRMASRNPERTAAKKAARVSPLVSLLDPQGSHPEIAPFLSSIPPVTTSHITKLISGYGDLEKDIVLRVVMEESLTSNGRDWDELGGIIHYAAAVAPVIAAFPDHVMVRDPDGSVSRDVPENIEAIRDMVQQHWRVSPAGFDLHEINRLYYVRGMMLLTFMPRKVSSRIVINDIELDRHLMWVGSRFDDLKPYVNEIVEEGSFSREFLEKVGSRWIPMDEYYDKDGIRSFSFFCKHEERLTGYDVYGFHSVLTESVLKDMQEKFGRGMVMNVSGLTIPLAEYSYLIMLYPEASKSSLYDKQFIKVAAKISAGNSDYAANAIIATTLMNFPQNVLDEITLRFDALSDEDRKAFFGVMHGIALSRLPMEPVESATDFTLTALKVFPVVHAFFEAEYEPEPFSDYDPDEDVDREDFDSDEEYLEELNGMREVHANGLPERIAEHQAEQEDHKSELLWQNVSYVYEHIRDSFAAATIEEGFVVMDSLYKALAMACMTEAEASFEGEDFDVLDEQWDAIIRNAGVLLETQDLSIEAIKALK